jgi:hypothetical protein
MFRQESTLAVRQQESYYFKVFNRTGSCLIKGQDSASSGAPIHWRIKGNATHGGSNHQRILGAETDSTAALS